ncbi:MAG TPA: hypothetical protein VGU20_19840 [Stellaceae bacterium]|nr:hypothetical protein [Stellaceae bacterium]
MEMAATMKAVPEPATAVPSPSTTMQAAAVLCECGRDHQHGCQCSAASFAIESLLCFAPASQRPSRLKLGAYPISCLSLCHQ